MAHGEKLWSSVHLCLSRDNQVQWYVETNYGHLHTFSIQRQASPMTRGDTLWSSATCQPEASEPVDTQRQIWSSVVLSKTQCLSTKTALVSHSSTRGKWARWHTETNMVICSFIEDSMSIDRDYFSLPFVNQRQASPLTRRAKYGHLLFCRRLNVYRPRLL